MAKKSKTIVYGGLPGEGKVYETTNHKIFMVETSVRNPMAEKRLLERYIANPECTTGIMQVIPVNKKTSKPADYYSSQEPNPGDVYLIVRPNDVIMFNAKVMYNQSRGFAANKLMAYRYEVVDLKSHKEKLYQFAEKDANCSTKKTDYISAVKYYNRQGIGIDTITRSRYTAIDNEANYCASKLNISGTGNPDNGDVKTVLIGQGHWNREFNREFKNGILNTFDSSLASETRNVVDFFVDLIAISGGTMNMRHTIINDFMKFYYDEVHNKGKVVDLKRILSFLRKNTAKARGRYCGGCGHFIAGYIARFNNIGIDKKETSSKIVHDMSIEPGF